MQICMTKNRLLVNLQDATRPALAIKYATSVPLVHQGHGAASQEPGGQKTRLPSTTSLPCQGYLKHTFPPEFPPFIVLTIPCASLPYLRLVSLLPLITGCQVFLNISE